MKKFLKKALFFIMPYLLIFAVYYPESTWLRNAEILIGIWVTFAVLIFVFIFCCIHFEGPLREVMKEQAHTEGFKKIKNGKDSKTFFVYYLGFYIYLSISVIYYDLGYLFFTCAAYVFFAEVLYKKFGELTKEIEKNEIQQNI